MPDSRLKKYLDKKRRTVDAALRRCLPKHAALPPVVHEAMRYSVFAGGKRLRPILCLAAAELCGGTAKRVMPTACALELIHTYSLVHDDLPAMDDDDFRRGLPTSHKKFGEGNAVLAGDALLTFGFQLMAENARRGRARPAAVLDVVRTVAEAAGSRGMVGGQAADLAMSGNGKNRNGEKTPDALRKKLDYIHRNKTAALIRASLRAGALLAGASPVRLNALDAYGRSIGLAFQIVDDILDIVGDKKLLGKRGSDRDNDKLTFPALYGLEASRRMARREVRRAKNALSLFGPRARILNDLADYIVERQN
ncbi:MAG TPA: polyprenyl synthetase family protein [Elusimicrobiota bacterium]|nr:polyprenyl synthetase family protein [Elusimicrobiota bacterium]